MAESQNGWVVLGSSSECARWVIPVDKGPERHVFLRPGDAGFILACWILWFHWRIHKINRGTWDEWGWALRNVRGSSSTISNHASGTAVDIDATLHPLGKRGTFNFVSGFRGWLAARAIRFKLNQWNNVIAWGGDYRNRADEMHFELSEDNATVVKVHSLAAKLAKRPVGKAILRANKHYKAHS